MATKKNKTVKNYVKGPENFEVPENLIDDTIANEISIAGTDRYVPELHMKPKKERKETKKTKKEKQTVTDVKGHMVKETNMTESETSIESGESENKEIVSEELPCITDDICNTIDKCGCVCEHDVINEDNNENDTIQKTVNESIADKKHMDEIKRNVVTSFMGWNFDC